MSDLVQCWQFREKLELEGRGCESLRMPCGLPCSICRVDDLARASRGSWPGPQSEGGRAMEQRTFNPLLGPKNRSGTPICHRIELTLQRNLGSTPRGHSNFLNSD